MNTQSPSDSSSANSHNDDSDGNNPLGVLDFDPTLFDPSAASKNFLETDPYGSFGRSYQPQYAYPAQNAAGPYYGPPTGNSGDLALLGLADYAGWPAFDAPLADLGAGAPNINLIRQAPPAMYDQQQLQFTNPPQVQHDQLFGTTELFANPPHFMQPAAYPPPPDAYPPVQQALGLGLSQHQGALPWQFGGHGLTAPPDAGPHMPPPPRHEPSPSARRPQLRGQPTARRPRRRAGPEPYATQEDIAATANDGMPESRGAPAAPRHAQTAAQLSGAGEDTQSLAGLQAHEGTLDPRAAQDFQSTNRGVRDGQQGAGTGTHHLADDTPAPELRDTPAIPPTTLRAAPTGGRGRKRARNEVDGESGPAPRTGKKARSAPAAAGPDDTPGKPGKQDPQRFLQFCVRAGPTHESSLGETSGAGSSNLGRNVQYKNNTLAHSGTQEDTGEAEKIAIWHGPERERPAPEKYRRYPLDEPRPKRHDWYCRVCRDSGVHHLYWQTVPKAKLHVKREHPEEGEPRHVVERGKGSGTKRKKQPPKDEERREDDKDKEGEE